MVSTTTYQIDVNEGHFVMRRKSTQKLSFVAAFLSIAGIPVAATSSDVTYGYDSLGRIRTAVYDNGLCAVYAYDPNGNRTSQTNTLGGLPIIPTWGSGTWGCFNWTP